MRHASEPTVVLGPILFFRGEQGDRWRLSALFVLDGETEPHDLGADGVGLPIPPRHVGRWQSRHLWRFDFAVPRGDAESVVAYGFGTERPWHLTVPGHDGRLNIAFTSCNGVQDEESLRKHPFPRNARWGELLARHAERPFHLLLQGGDQLYADAVWRDAPLLRAWWKKPERERWSQPFDAAMASEAMAFYFDLYMKVWSQPEIAEAFCRIPSVMMWDDHDVFDGFGSHPEPGQSSPVSRGVALAARRHFTMFQLGTIAEAPPESVWGGEQGGFTQGFRVGSTGILALDLRSERTRRRVLSPESWDALPDWLARFAGCRRLLVMSSMPLLYPDTGRLERLVRKLPFNTGYEDDLRDQWRSYAHADSWRRMTGLLTGFSRANRCKVTVLSGEVHAGGRGRLRDGDTEIWQLVASGVVHPPPPWLAVAILERLAAVREHHGDVIVDFPPFPETGRHIIRQRNWLSLSLDGGAMHAEWHAEGKPERYTQEL